MSCELDNFLRSRSRSHNYVKFAVYLQWTLCFFDKEIGAWSCRVFLAISRMHVTCDFVRHASRYGQHMLLSGHTEASFESEAESEAPPQICHPNARCLNGLSRIRIHDDSWCILLAVGRDG